MSVHELSQVGGLLAAPRLLVVADAPLAREIRVHVGRPWQLERVTTAAAAQDALAQQRFAAAVVDAVHVGERGAQPLCHTPPPLLLLLATRPKGLPPRYPPHVTAVWRQHWARPLRALVASATVDHVLRRPRLRGAVRVLAHRARLSPRAIEMLAYLVADYSRKELALLFDVAPSTVASTCAAIRDNAGAHDLHALLRELRRADREEEEEALPPHERGPAV